MSNFLIIGGSTGIGAALAKELSTEHKVYVTYNAHEVSNESNITYTKYDVMNDEFAIADLPEELHGLAYCPGAINLKPFARIKPEDFMNDYQLQVIGAVKVIQTVLPNLKKSGGASIVLFSTVAVQTGFNFHTVVSSSKGAIEGLTRALAAEFAPTIRVNAIAPSITNTPLASALLNTEDKIQANAQRHPLKAIGAAEDIASLAAHLLSAKAKWITGQIFTIDGGMSALRV
jgi:NAD(P)-dependent dehydrogenase (short-subunit alcohol dehydrogenase family)